MGLTIVTSPVTLPVTVQQVKDTSRITYSDAGQDDLLSLYIQMGVNYIQSRLNRQLMTATYKYTEDCFPCGMNPIWLPIAPVQSVTKVEYVAEDGTLVEWDDASYVVDVIGEPARIQPVWGGSWPVYQQTLNALQVTFVAGYGNAAAVPAELKYALCMLAAHAYEQREATTDVKLWDVPFGVTAQLDLKRWHPNSFVTLI